MADADNVTFAVRQVSNEIEPSRRLVRDSEKSQCHKNPRTTPMGVPPSRIPVTAGEKGRGALIRRLNESLTFSSNRNISRRGSEKLKSKTRKCRHALLER